MHLANEVKAFTLFSTHYFELTRLPSTQPHTINVHLSAAENNDDIVFLHKVLPGAANQSYGIQVARLAGIPQRVIAYAKQKLTELEGI